MPCGDTIPGRAGLTGSAVPAIARHLPELRLAWSGQQTTNCSDSSRSTMNRMTLDCDGRLRADSAQKSAGRCPKNAVVHAERFAQHGFLVVFVSERQHPMSFTQRVDIVTELDDMLPVHLHLRLQRTPDAQVQPSQDEQRQHANYHCRPRDRRRR